MWINFLNEEWNKNHLLSFFSTYSASFPKVRQKQRKERGGKERKKERKGGRKGGGNKGRPTSLKQGVFHFISVPAVSISSGVFQIQVASQFLVPSTWKPDTPTTWNPQFALELSPFRVHGSFEIINFITWEWFFSYLWNLFKIFHTDTHTYMTVDYIGCKYLAILSVTY